jgi:hypothetical protein
VNQRSMETAGEYPCHTFSRKFSNFAFSHQSIDPYISWRRNPVSEMLCSLVFFFRISNSRRIPKTQEFGVLYTLIRTLYTLQGNICFHEKFVDFLIFPPSHMNGHPECSSFTYLTPPLKFGNWSNFLVVLIISSTKARLTCCWFP